MSILIRGMEMPTDGTVFVIDSTGQVWSNEWPTRGYIRLDGVTAVPVPKHGDLIDRDALLSQYKGNIWTAKTDYAEGLRDAAKDIACAPTIIPAEEDET